MVHKVESKTEKLEGIECLKNLWLNILSGELKQKYLFSKKEKRIDKVFLREINHQLFQSAMEDSEILKPKRIQMSKLRANIIKTVVSLVYY